MLWQFDDGSIDGADTVLGRPTAPTTQLQLADPEEAVRWVADQLDVKLPEEPKKPAVEIGYVGDDC